MARLGDFYINNGQWNGEQLLPENWILEAQQISSPLLLNRFAHDEQYKAYVKSEGVFSNRSFWLNQDIPHLDMQHEFPHAPADMFFAAGHYGQLLIILPSQKIVIAATGHNKEYWSKIDKLVSHAVACYSPESKLEVGSTPAPIEQSVPFLKQLGLAHGVLKKEILQGIISKEMCSCVYVSGLTLDQCLDHASLPMSRSQLNSFLKIKQYSEQDKVKAKPKILGQIIALFGASSRSAIYNGESLGCRLQFP
jgi:hypothetical protein